MRNQGSGQVLTPANAFSMNRLDVADNFETGVTSTIGFDYKFQNNRNELDFSVAQIINERENRKMPSKTGLDEKLSDLVALQA